MRIDTLCRMCYFCAWKRIAKMQVRKEYLRDDILREAKSLFLANGFAKTSMRDIAKRSGVGLGNIYNYFASKDEIFKAVIAPLLAAFDHLLIEHHSVTHVDEMVTFLEGGSETVFGAQYDICLQLLRYHRTELELFFLKSQGSAVQGLEDEYVDKCTETVTHFMEQAGGRMPQSNCMFHPVTYRLHTLLFSR